MNKITAHVHFSAADVTSQQFHDDAYRPFAAVYVGGASLLPQGDRAEVLVALRTLATAAAAAADEFERLTAPVTA